MKQAYIVGEEYQNLDTIKLGLELEARANDMVRNSARMIDLWDYEYPYFRDTDLGEKLSGFDAIVCITESEEVLNGRLFNQFFADYFEVLKTKELHIINLDQTYLSSFALIGKPELKSVTSFPSINEMFEGWDLKVKHNSRISDFIANITNGSYEESHIGHRIFG